MSSPELIEGDAKGLDGDPYQSSLEIEFRRSRWGTIVLLWLALAALGNLILLATGYFVPSPGWRLPDRLAFLGVWILVALVAAFFAWRARSRAAMCVGLMLVALNWASCIAEMASGRFSAQGAAINLLAPVLLVRGLLAAHRYQELKRTEESRRANLFD